MPETYIEFIEAPPAPSGKTRRWLVQAKEGGRLGAISWYAPWRCYAFFPIAETVYEHRCLRDIGAFCAQRSVEHRETRTTRIPTRAPQPSQGHDSV